MMLFTEKCNLLRENVERVGAQLALEHDEHPEVGVFQRIGPIGAASER